MSTNLLITLVAVGIALIGAVVVYNWFQEKKIRQDTDARFRVPDSDALMGKMRAIERPQTTFGDTIDAAMTPRMPKAQTPQENFKDSFTELIPDQKPANEFPQDEHVESEDVTVEHKISTIPEIQDLEPNLRLPGVAVKRVDEAFPTTVFMGAPELDLSGAVEQSAETPVDENSPNDSSVSATDDFSPTVFQPYNEAPKNDVASIPGCVDSQVDLLALLHLNQAASTLVLQDFYGLTKGLDKLVQVLGYRNAHWQEVKSAPLDTSFEKVICSIQLADRSGYISKNSLTHFQSEVDKLGAKLTAHVEWLSATDPWRYASELDQFCIDVDKLIGFHLIESSNGGMAGTKIKGLAESGGMVFAADGVFQTTLNNGNRAYVLVNKDGVAFSQESLRTSSFAAISFQLDIPRVENFVEVFNQMVLLARQMENSLAATLVDDHLKPVGEVQIEKVRQQLKQIQAKMLARGIVPGSETALRLFS